MKVKDLVSCCYDKIIIYTPLDDEMVEYKDLYKGEIVNKGTPWACRMDGGQVVPCVIKHSKIGVAGLAITIAGEAQPMNWVHTILTNRGVLG